MGFPGTHSGDSASFVHRLTLHDSFDTQDMQTNTGSTPTFALYNPKAWKAFSEAFTGYVKHISSLEKDPPNPAEATISNNNYSFENMTYAPSGLPLLPEAVKNDFGTETTKMKQGILRVYLSKHYSMSIF